jgi:hypothetical protein
MRIIKSGTFWIGVGVGLVAVPFLLSRFAPGLKARIPGANSGETM